MTNNKNNELYNASGYVDKTAYKAIRNIKKEERRKLIMKLKAVANQHGYDIISIIRLQELEDTADGK